MTDLEFRTASLADVDAIVALVESAYRSLRRDIIEGRRTIDQVGHEIRDLVVAVANGQQTASEGLGHREFILTYKSFDPIGPACLPRMA